MSAEDAARREEGRRVLERMHAGWAVPPGAHYITSKLFGTRVYLSAHRAEFVVTPEFVRRWAPWERTLTTVHRVLHEFEVMRTFWGLWWCPASAIGFSPDLINGHTITDMGSMGNDLGLPLVEFDERTLRCDLSEEELEAYASLAQVHAEKMTALVSRWLKAASDLRLADAHAVRVQRARNKRGDDFAHQCVTKSFKTVWEMTLTGAFHENDRAHARDGLFSSSEYYAPRARASEPEARLAKLMRERAVLSLRALPQAWRTRAIIESRKGRTGVDALEPTEAEETRAPFPIRVLFWVDCECAKNVLKLQVLASTKPGREAMRSTFADVVCAHEVFMSKMGYLSVQAARAQLGLALDKPATRMKMMARTKKLLACPTIESLFDEEAIARELTRAATEKFTSTNSGEAAGVEAEQVAAFGAHCGTTRAWYELALERDERAITALHDAIDKKLKEHHDRA